MRVSARAVESEHDGGDEDDPGGDEEGGDRAAPHNLFEDETEEAAHNEAGLQERVRHTKGDRERVDGEDAAEVAEVPCQATAEARPESRSKVEWGARLATRAQRSEPYGHDEDRRGHHPDAEGWQKVDGLVATERRPRKGGRCEDAATQDADTEGGDQPGQALRAHRSTIRVIAHVSSFTIWSKTTSCPRGIPILRGICWDGSPRDGSCTLAPPCRTIACRRSALAPKRLTTHAPRESHLTMPKTPTRSSVIAIALSATEPRGFEIAGGPKAPHKKLTTTAAPLQVPCPVDRPIFEAATKERPDAPTKSEPAKKPNHVNAN